MQRLKQTALKEISKIPMLHHLLWKGKLMLRSGCSNVKVVSILEATNYVLKLADKIPNDFDVIIGIPRSGLWVASVLALKFGRPLSTPNAFVNGEVWHSLHVEKPVVHKVLVVEDDVLYGKQIGKACHQLKEFDDALEVKTASLFVTSKAKNLLDYYYQVRNPPLLYEWTLLTNLAGMGKLAVDMDGVLCEECPVNVDLNEQAYINWLGVAKSHLIPQFYIEAVVTSRLEKYRDQTEKWLKSHGVKYGKLLMLNLQDKQTRTLDSIVKHKSDSIKQLGLFWFWESNLVEAQALKSKTGLPILCTGNMTLLL